MALPTEVQRSVALRDLYAAGYQGRQFGVAGPSVLPALEDPPQAMQDAYDAEST